MQSVNLAQKFALFDDSWGPKIAGELNHSYVKLVKLKGEFVWHHHEREDELFLVVKGRLLLRLRDREVWVNEGEFAIVPKGVEHLPVAREEVHVLLIEPKSTLNTGNVRNERTIEELDRICPPAGRPVVARRHSGRSGRRVRRLPPANRRQRLPRDAGEPRRPGAAPHRRGRDALPLHLVLGVDGRDPRLRGGRHRPGALLPRGPEVPARARADRLALRRPGALGAITHRRARRSAAAAPRALGAPASPPLCT